MIDNSKKADTLAIKSNEVEQNIDQSVNNMQNTISDIENIINGYIKNTESTNIILTEIDKINDLSLENKQSVNNIVDKTNHMTKMSIELTKLLEQYKA